MGLWATLGDMRTNDRSTLTADSVKSFTYSRQFRAVSLWMATRTIPAQTLSAVALSRRLDDLTLSLLDQCRGTPDDGGRLRRLSGGLFPLTHVPEKARSG